MFDRSETFQKLLENLKTAILVRESFSLQLTASTAIDKIFAIENQRIDTKDLNISSAEKF